MALHTSMTIYYTEIFDTLKEKAICLNPSGVEFYRKIKKVARKIFLF